MKFFDRPGVLSGTLLIGSALLVAGVVIAYVTFGGAA